MLQLQKNRRQQREINELARGVEANGGGPFMFREPSSDHLVIDRVGMGFKSTYRHAQNNRGNEDCGHRPQQKANWVQQTRLNSVDQPTAG